MAALLERELRAGDGAGDAGIVEAAVLPQPGHGGVDFVAGVAAA